MIGIAGGQRLQSGVICDWLTGSHRFREPVKPFESGRVMKVDADGCLEWEKRDWQSIKCPSSDTAVRFQLDGQKLRFSGNFGRFGHRGNVEGLPLVQVAERIPELLRFLECDWRMFGTLVAKDSAMEWGTRISRVDLAGNFEVSDYAGWCRMLMMRSIGRNRPFAGKYGPTWGYQSKASHWWRAKVYDKAAELAGERGPRSGATLARFEVQLGREYLRREQLDTVQAWTNRIGGMDMGTVIYGRFLAELERDQASVEDWTVIPSRIRHWAVLWANGENVRGQMSQSAFYRSRARLLEFGIDIATVPNVVALSSKRRSVDVVQVSALRVA